MEKCGAMDLPAGVGVGAAVEYIAACVSGDGCFDEAVVALRALGPHAPPVAFVLVIEASCRGLNPNMQIARGALEMMAETGALASADMSETVAVYVSLVAGCALRLALRAVVTRAAQTFAAAI
eukprot:5857428-Pleurochrysis_carterae.AAC.1